MNKQQAAVQQDLHKRRNKMMQNTMNKMEEMVRKDGSLSEERKSALLSLLKTMKPEMTKLYKSQEEYVESIVRLNNNNEVSVWKKNKLS